jgi:hypothetical protein
MHKYISRELWFEKQKTPIEQEIIACCNDRHLSAYTKVLFNLHQKRALASNYM